MARRGWTEKPCENCGTTDGRATGELCVACKKLVEEAVAARERQSKKRGLVARRHSKNTHWNPYYFIGSQSDHDIVDGLRRVMTRVVMAAAEEPALGKDWSYDTPFLFQSGLEESRYGYREYGEMSAPILMFDKELALALDALDKMVVDAIIEARRCGYNEGTQLLNRLASGEIGDTEFKEQQQRLD